MSLMDLLNKKSLLPLESEALKGREEEIEIPTEHFVKETPLKACLLYTSPSPRDRG